MRAYGPRELGPEPSGSYSHSRRVEKEMLISRLFGYHKYPGPLMSACQHAAEYERARGRRTR
jgi:hypothetical protein